MVSRHVVQCLPPSGAVPQAVAADDDVARVDGSDCVELAHLVSRPAQHTPVGAAVAGRQNDRDGRPDRVRLDAQGPAMSGVVEGYVRKRQVALVGQLHVPVGATVARGDDLSGTSQTQPWRASTNVR